MPGRLKSGIIPLGNLTQVAEDEFYKNPMVPWWVKLVQSRGGDLKRTSKRVAKWCHICGRKHSRDDECKLELRENLTTMPKRVAEGMLAHAIVPVGYYTQLTEEN